MWRRLIRSRGFVLLIFAVIFSFGILGQVDTRMHIGGSDWDLDSLIYINVDDYLLEDFAYLDSDLVRQDVNPSREELPTLQTTFHAEANFDKTTTIASGNPEYGPIEMLDFEQTRLAVVTAGEDSVADSVADVTIEIETETSVETLLADGTETLEVPEAVARVEAPVPVSQPPQVVEEKKPETKQEKAPIFVHKVRSGETLWDIALAYGVSVDTISSANDLRNKNYLSIGQELQIPSVNGVLHQIASGESLWEISERYNVPVDEITRVNEISDPSRIQPNMKIVIPGATQLRPRDVLLVNGQLQKAFDWPVRGRISSAFGPRWGRMHNGLDLAVSTGTHVKAAADGRVTFAGWNGGYGILVIIDHGNGIETRYAHNSRLNVKVGQRVSRGETVAYSGNTGVSTGPHVHFEIRYRNNPVNPQTYLK
ncbi:MAG: peptidoglycan DD-metalloendopeptidase family protein [Firmicutes bacterium]|nr:peptidoglycan DD-metalloendopeptidase family protein [Bacillota bacterium]